MQNLPLFPLNFVVLFLIPVLLSLLGKYGAGNNICDYPKCFPMKKTLLLPIAIIISLSLAAQTNRTYNGTGNNLANPEWGEAEGSFRNYVSNGYSDKISTPAAPGRENPRVVSNTLGSQTAFTPNELGLSDFIWGWGQFIDHDINLNDDNFAEGNNIDVPMCDTLFDPFCTDTMDIRMFRSRSDTGSGKDTSNPRKHINEITSYIDASGVYGSTQDRADWLRTNTDGKLKTSAGNLLPWNTTDGEFGSAVDATAPFMVIEGHPKATKFFVGGDVRINEQPGLVAFHTLWVREHNRLCDELKTANPGWTDEELFQRARKMVGALIQAVTYEEFLPNMGIILPTYTTYNNSVDASIMNAFSAAAYRFGHTMVNGRLMRYDEDGSNWSFGAIDLRNGFFNPDIIKDEGGIEPFFRGLAAQEHQLVDPMIMDDIRNFLFGPPGAGGLDLLSINLARGRERGLPDYNTIRTDLLLTPHASFGSLTSDNDLSNDLSTVYGTIDNVDPWIGFMSEDHMPNAIVGEGLYTILSVQFAALRDGDRYYYENDPAFTAAEIAAIKATTLSEIILRNTDITTLQANVFKAEPRQMVSVELFPFANISNITINAYPNPIQKYFTLKIKTRRPGTANLSIMDLNGRLVKEEALILTAGENEMNFELSDELASGVYTILLQSADGDGQLKLVKQKG